MAKVNGREKGKRGELELAKILSHLFATQCRRGQQFSGIEGRDVIGLDGIHIECKRVERLNLYGAMDQAIRDAKDGDVPIVCHRQNLKEWLVTCQLADLPKLVKVLCSED